MNDGTSCALEEDEEDEDNQPLVRNRQSTLTHRQGHQDRDRKQSNVNGSNHMSDYRQKGE